MCDKLLRRRRVDVGVGFTHPRNRSERRCPERWRRACLIETSLPLEGASLQVARRGKPGKANQDTSEQASDEQSHAIPLPGDGAAFLLQCHFALVAYLSRKSIKRPLSWRDGGAHRSHKFDSTRWRGQSHDRLSDH